ncbi:zona pellucida protein C isoform X1 [Fundulus heteroclitus]|uniref:zona pellucida protein C isoform X1 n=1 Tax=Fundulus heteroclitus TaxID=8078 RepID=UPI00165B45C8|nr:zona pellucida protein C isoform X1 [Fundulus heteroclitus]
MGTVQQVLWSVLWGVIAVQSFQRPEDAMFPQDFPGPFDNNWLFPFEGNLDFPPLDTIFSSWQKWSPDFHMLAEFPPTMNLPRVQVSCDETKLTLLVDKKAFGLTLTAEDIQLGNGCYSNKEEPSHLVFDYNLDQCGTTPVLQNGLQAFTNSLHLNLRTPATPWQTLPTIHISCIPKRFHTEPNFISQPSWTAKRFDLQAMNPSWTHTAESNVYKRGLLVRLQVSAETRPGQQLFIHSCFVSSSPEPQTRPRHAVILNKGCASSLGSPHTVARFAATNRADVVKFMLNTSYLIAELYIHCSVVLSDQGVNVASKSCNYNMTSSRWEELSGDADVCACCRSKCKGPSIKNLPDEAKAVVSVGPLMIVDEWELIPTLPDTKPLAASGSSLPTTMRASAPAEDDIISAAFPAQAELQSSSQGVLVVRQEPTARLTMWLPGQDLTSQPDGLLVQDGYSVQEVSTAYGNSLTRPTNETDESPSGSSQWDMKLVTPADGLQIPQQENEVEEFQSKSRNGRSGNSDTEAAQPDFSLPTEINVNLMLVEKPKVAMPDATAEKIQMKWPSDDPAVSSEMQMDAEAGPDEEVQPVIRTKLEFSKGADGSKRLSYEEELKQEKRHAKDNLKRKPRLKGLRSTFLDLLRKMDKEE